MSRRAEPANYSLDSVDRMAAVLRALEQGPDSSLEQVARRSGLTLSTALRYLLSLSQHGYVDRDDASGLFRLGLGLFRLGTLAIDSRDVIAVAGTVMEKLQAQFGELVNFATRQQNKVMLLRVVEGPQSLRKGGNAGEIDPWHATALGKAILAGLPPDDCRAILDNITLDHFTPNTKLDRASLEQELQACRKQGYAIDDEEVIEGLRCVGAAVRDHNGVVQFGLSISGPKSRMPYSRIQEIGGALISAAADLSARLGSGRQTRR